MTKSRALGASCAVLFTLAVVAANWAVHRYGAVPVWPGVKAPASVYVVSVALLARNGVQWFLGKPWALVCIAVGIGLSYLLADAHIATASGVGFAASELAEFTVFTICTTLLVREWMGATALAAAVGIIVDSLMFLHLAFHSYEFLKGQLIGKSVAVLIGLLLLTPLRLRHAEPATA